MKKILCLITAVLTALVLAVPVFAAEDIYVPSITAKPAPQLESRAQDPAGRPVIQVKNEDQEVVHSSAVENLVITSVAEVVAEEDVRISEEAGETLKEAFEILEEKGTETFEEIPELVRMVQEADRKVEDLVVMDLFDVSIVNEELEQFLNQEGNTIELTFAMNLPADQEVYVMVYKENRWQMIESAVNNGDGTVTCVFDHFCPVAILTAPSVAEEENPPAVPAAQTQTPEKTFLWWIALVAAAAVFLVLKHKGAGTKG